MSQQTPSDLSQVLSTTIDTTPLSNIDNHHHTIVTPPKKQDITENHRPSSACNINYPIDNSTTSTIKSNHSNIPPTAHDHSGPIKYSDQIDVIVEGITTKENNKAIINITTPPTTDDLDGKKIEVDNNSSGKIAATNSWRFQSGGDQFGGRSEENTLLSKSNLDRVIIGSSTFVGGTAADDRIGKIATIATDSVASGHSSSSSEAKFPGGGSVTNDINNLIQISDKDFHSSPPEQTIAQLAQKSTSSHSTPTPTSLPANNFSNPADSKRLRFKSLLDTVAASSSATSATTITTATTTTATTNCDSSSGELNSVSGSSSSGGNSSSKSDSLFRASTTGSVRISECDSYELADRTQERILLDTLHENIQEEEEYEDRSSGSDEDKDSSSIDGDATTHGIGQFESYTKFNTGRKRLGGGSSFRKSTTRLLAGGGGHVFIRIQRLLGVFNSKFIDDYKETPYVPYESRDLLTGDSKYPDTGASGAGGAAAAGQQRKKRHFLGGKGSGGGKTFRGSYKYSRAEISMAIFKKLINLLFQKATLALIGAFLIHITLGTVYTLSNINSYLTSYMRLHGSPTLTYGGSMWISSFYAIGQGFSMVLGGYLEKRFSARLACFLGCLVHSGAIMSTSWSINYGSLAVLMSYGFLPGFGCGLAYMTPMSNGFGWFPNRRGLVAGVILAGFGIGTFVFNIAQTAYVNPENLSPPEDSQGYFTQESILTKVPGLFLFIGSIYAAMQFVGCCLLFKPPSNSDYYPGKSSSSSSSLSDERPILETEMSVGRAVKTREFAVLFLVYGIITQGVLFVNSMIKEYGQLFIGDDMYLAWTGSMASIANALGRLLWGLAIDRYTFTQCFTCITTIFGLLMFLMPFEFVLSSKHLYLLCTLGIFGSFSGWMSTFPVHLSRTFGRLNSGMLYGLIFISQSLLGIASAFGSHYLIDHYTRFVPFFCVVFLEILGLAIYHLFYPKQRHNI